jgi:hypothetical protein
VDICPKCGHENVDSSTYCARCGTYLADGPSTALLAPDELPATPQGGWHQRDPEPKTSQAVLVLLAPNGAMVALPQVPTVNLGREGISRAGMAAIDLTPCGADVAGVSRLHARIHRLSTGYFIEDCDSTNGTFLNGQRLVAYMPLGLATGDEVQLGQLRFKVTFQSVG